MVRLLPEKKASCCTVLSGLKIIHADALGALGTPTRARAYSKCVA